METATLAGGCFWCLEAVYQEMKGIDKIVSGYMGGHTERPNYEGVCTGLTGHAEVVQLTFDPATITFRQILEVFFAIHDPTTLNRQGNDHGTQYRSAIFFHTPEQETAAREIVAELTPDFGDAIVTEITPAVEFFPGEKYHQNYFRDHPYQPYCMFAVSPKLSKFRSKFAGLRREA